MGYNLKTDYDFSAVDSVMPDIVMSDICNELEKITKGFVVANVREYDGKIESYDTIGAMAALAASLQTSMRVDIQDKLGVIDETSFKYEMYLTASQIENYKYRILFIGYGITGYPAKIVLEQDIADELKILSATKKRKLIDANNHPDKKISDHLPIIFEIMEG